MRKLTGIVLFIGIGLLFIGCSSSEPSLTPTEGISPTPTQTTPPALPPTSTPLPPVVALLAAADADSDLISALTPFVSSWAKEEGFRFQSLERMSAEDLNEVEFRLIVALPPQPDLQSLVEAAPEVHFLAVGFSNLDSGENLSVILPGNERYDHHGFMAGYLAAMVTEEWRVGAIGLKDDPYAEQARKAFTLGVRYFCGLCLPDHPPYEYPLIVELPPDASSAEWQSSANILTKKGVETFYIVPGAGDDSLFRFLIQNDIQMIGDGRFFREEFQEGWIASLEFDLVEAVKNYWPDFVSGEVGEEIAVPLIIRDINSDLLSPGRLHNAESLLEEVEGGWIETDEE